MSERSPPRACWAVSTAAWAAWLAHVLVWAMAASMSQATMMVKRCFMGDMTKREVTTPSPSERGGVDVLGLDVDAGA